jgi:hypothetical protein
MELRVAFITVKSLTLGTEATHELLLMRDAYRV